MMHPCSRRSGSGGLWSCSDAARPHRALGWIYLRAPGHVHGAARQDLLPGARLPDAAGGGRGRDRGVAGGMGRHAREAVAEAPPSRASSRRPAFVFAPTDAAAPAAGAVRRLPEGARHAAATRPRSTTTGRCRSSSATSSAGRSWWPRSPGSTDALPAERAGEGLHLRRQLRRGGGHQPVRATPRPADRHQRPPDPLLLGAAGMHRRGADRPAALAGGARAGLHLGGGGGPPPAPLGDGGGERPDPRLPRPQDPARPRCGPG